MAPLHYLNAIRGTGSYIEQQKTPGAFLFLVQTKLFCLNSRKNGKGLAEEFCSYIVLYPTLRKSAITKYAADNCMTQQCRIQIFFGYTVFLKLRIG